MQGKQQIAGPASGRPIPANQLPNIRQGDLHDLAQIRELAISAWGEFKSDLTPDNWEKLLHTLADEKTYTNLLLHADTTKKKSSPSAFLYQAEIPLKFTIAGKAILGY